MYVAIFGAAGAVGAPTLAELRRRNHRVRLVGRSTEPLVRLAADDPDVDVVSADLSDLAAARRAAAGVDAIVYAVGIDYHKSAQYPGLMRVTIEAARAEHVRELLLIGTVYPYGFAQTPRVAETHPRTPHTRKGGYRNAQLQAVLDAHDPAGLLTTALILPDFYGPGVEKSYAKALFDSALDGTTATIIAPADTPHEFIYIPDAAPVIADLLERPDAFGTHYHLGGPGTISQRDLGRLAYEAAGRDPATLKLFPVPKWMLALMGIGNAFMREIPEMMYLFEQPVILDDSKLRALLPHIRETSYADGVRTTIATRNEAVHV
jgi:nucleoside-diphosphate-sugar epimerase